jgi:serine protease Do
MNSSHWSKKAAALAALMGTTLLPAYPIQAQNPVTLTTDTEGGPGRPLSRGPLALVQRAPGLELGLDQLRKTWGVADSNTFVVTFQDPADEMLGATLQPVGDTLRAQLAIPPGQGLLVTGLRGEGPSAQAGLQQNDVLLSLADNPLAVADDLTKYLKAAGESAVPLRILRAGKPITIQIRPIYRVTLGPVAEERAAYYIGVSIDAADDAVRAQLGLPEGQGVVVTEVVGGGPADKAGVKKHDIVLELGGKPIDSPQTLAQQVQAAQDQPTTIKLLRAGKPVTISVTGAVKQAEVARAAQDAIRLWMFTGPELQNYVFHKQYFPEQLSAPAGSDDLRGRLDQVEKELKALRAAVEKVNETLKADKTKRE